MMRSVNNFPIADRQISLSSLVQFQSRSFGRRVPSDQFQIIILSPFGSNELIRQDHTDSRIVYHLLNLLATSGEI